VMPALANAVYDAIGVRIDEVPITPEKIVKALQAKAAGKPARYGPIHFPTVRWPETLQVPPPWEGGDGKARNENRKLQTADWKTKSEASAKREAIAEAPAAMPAAASAKRDADAKASASGGGAPREIKK
jgi:hypothetical protein